MESTQWLAWLWGSIALLIVICALAAWVSSRKQRRWHELQAGDRLNPAEGAGSNALVAMMSLDDVKQIYAQRKARHEVRLREVADRLAELRAREWETASWQQILENTLPQELETLRVIAKADAKANAPALVEIIRRAGSNATASFTRWAMGRVPHVSCREVVEDAAKKLGARNWTQGANDAAVERAAIVAAFNTTLKNATPQQRKELEAKLSASDRKAMAGLGVAGTALLGASASGFGLYVASSTVLGSLTSALGVTLPFAAYTGMSSIIAAVTGPIGWIALLGMAATVVGGVDYKVTVPAVIAIATVRARLIAERDQEHASLETERHGPLVAAAEQIAKLETFIRQTSDKGLHTVPRDSVPL